MRKIKSIVATALSLGMVMAGSLTSFAAELPEQRPEEAVSIESIASPAAVTAYESGTYAVKGNGVRLRRTAGTSGEIVGLLYESEGAWVEIDGTTKTVNNMTWLYVTDSSIDVKGWIAAQYIYPDPID